MPDDQTNHLEPRVHSLERDVASLANSVKSLATTVEHGFAKSAESSERMHLEVQQEIREIAKRTDNIGRPNYNAIGVAFAVIIAVLGYYVASQTGPIQEQLNAERDARVAADQHSVSDGARSAERLFNLAGSVVSATPEQRSAFIGRVDALENRITALETWDQARKLWKDGKP